MNKKINLLLIQTIARAKFVTAWLFPKALFGGVVTAMLLGGYWSIAQTAPVLTMVRAGTNQFSITVTNGVPTSTYTLLQTRVLGDPGAYPWRYVTNGITGQTNFMVPAAGQLPEFYEVLATNFTIGSFGMFIDSPVNGATLTQ